MPVTGLDQVLGNADAYLVGVRQRAEQAMVKITADLQAWAQAEHPYQDDTGANTASIKGFVAEVTPSVIRGVLSANMEYSVFLELARGGKYAFLLPVIERHRADIIKVLESVMPR